MRHCIIFATVLFFGFGCGNKENRNETHRHSHAEMTECSTSVHHHSQEAIESAEPGEGSIFHLTSEWRNQNNDVVTLGDLGGKVSIVSMIYTHCQFACPRILADMEAIERDLKSRDITNVNYVLVSIDPARDTPERLKAFYKENKLGKEWTLLTGDDESVMELAAVLGVKYKAMGKTDYSHSNLITVLDPGGEIVHRQEGLGTSPEETVTFISVNM